MDDENSIDLQLARLRQKAEKNLDEDEDREKIETFITRTNAEIKKAEGLSLSSQPFFNGLFHMLIPSGLAGEPIDEGNVNLFQNQEDHMALAVKMIDSRPGCGIEDLKKEYIRLMRQSKQQTEIALSGSCGQEFGEAYYFLATHSMPEEGQCDFIALFEIGGQTALMDFSFPQGGRPLWEKVIKAVLPTIRKAEWEVDGGI